MKVANSHWQFSLEQDAFSKPQPLALECAGGSVGGGDATKLEAGGKGGERDGNGGEFNKPNEVIIILH